MSSSQPSSRLQGWMPFDGLPGPEQVGAGGQAEASANHQQLNPQIQQSQQQFQRFNPLPQVTNNNMNAMTPGAGPLRMQQQPACPPRPAAAPEEERFLKPVENQDPNPAQHHQQQQQLANQNHLQSTSAPHSPPQQQRAIGNNVGSYQMSEMPQNSNDVLMRNDFAQVPAMMRSSPPQSGSMQGQPNSSHVGNIQHMPGFQPMPGMPGFNMQQFQNAEGGGLRFSKASSGSPSPNSSPSPFHHQQAYNTNNGPDEVAELFAASHLDRPGSPTNRGMNMRGSRGSPPDQQAFPAHEFIDLQEVPEGEQTQGQSERGAGWQFQDAPPKGYKTVICKFWENNMCTKGSNCTFAHGTEDLKRFAGSGPAYRSKFPLEMHAYCRWCS
jgi:hypothetical protein